MEEIAISILEVLSKNLVAPLGERTAYGLVVAGADSKLQVTDAFAGTLQALGAPRVVTVREQRELLLAATKEDGVAEIANYIKIENVAVESFLRLKILDDENDAIESYDISHVSSSYAKSISSLNLTGCFLMAK